MAHAGGRSSCGSTVFVIYVFFFFFPPFVSCSSSYYFSVSSSWGILLLGRRGRLAFLAGEVGCLF